MVNLLPIATTVLAALLSIEPLHIGGYAALTPAFTLMATYHWTIYRPDLLPAPSLFMIGTAQDLLLGGLPGVTAVTLLLARAIVLTHRHYFIDRLFPFVWAGFTLLTGVAMLFLWALHSLLAAEFLDLREPVFHAVLTISVFPVASFLLGRSQRALIGAD
ncbi:MAG TPA: rod shape-determining protein MreD [Stellaceae bacterium]|nr:rod shape-determining protein MreD [Stellaceae bacterium]